MRMLGAVAASWLTCAGAFAQPVVDEATPVEPVPVDVLAPPDQVAPDAEDAPLKPFSLVPKAATAPVVATARTVMERLSWFASLDGVHQRVSGFELGADRTFPEHQEGLLRLRAGAELPLGAPGFRLYGEADLFADRVYGGPQSVGGATVPEHVREGMAYHPHVLNPRALYAALRGTAGEIRLGLRTDRWGLGIATHDGARTDGLFDAPTRGDVVLGSSVTFNPLGVLGYKANTYAGRLTWAIAGDLVYADEYASLITPDGFGVHDTAWRTLTRLYVTPSTSPTASQDLSGGFEFALRDQADDGGTMRRVWTFDTHARYLQRFGVAHQVRYEAEVINVWGETDRVLSGADEAVDVRSGGAAFEVDYTYAGALPFSFALLGGFASSDGDPNDGTHHAHRFHGDYAVGRVFFDRVRPALERASVASAARVPGADLTGQSALAGRGGVTGASYGGFKVQSPITPSVNLGLQYVALSTAGSFDDPWASFEAGGVRRGPFGGDPAGMLGHEVNVAARYTLPDDWFGPIEAATRLSYGVFLPGEALEGPDGELGAVHLIELALSIDTSVLGGR